MAIKTYGGRVRDSKGSDPRRSISQAPEAWSRHSALSAPRPKRSTLVVPGWQKALGLLVHRPPTRPQALHADPPVVEERCQSAPSAPIIQTSRWSALHELAAGA